MIDTHIDPEFFDQAAKRVGKSPDVDVALLATCFMAASDQVMADNPFVEMISEDLRHFLTSVVDEYRTRSGA